MLKWTPNKDPNDIDYYSVVVDAKWLDGSVISSASMVASTDSELVISDVTVDGYEVKGRFSGGVVGTHKVEVTINSNTRTRQQSVYLTVKEK